MTLTSDSVVQAIPHLVSADMGEEVILLHLRNGQYFGLQNVGARIWDLLRTPRSVGEIQSTLLAEYDVEPETCWNEVERLLEELVERDLVEVRSA